MLNLLLYQNEAEISKFEFLQNEFDIKKFLIITPDPSHADELRLSIEGQIQESHLIIEVDTISNFLKKLIFDHFSKEVDSKANLMLQIGKKWGQTNLKFQDYHFFSQVFKLFTEIRSFSVDPNIFDETLNELPQDISLGIRSMDKIYGGLELIDEHEAYFRLSSSSLKYVNYDGVLIWGFKFLSGPQIDFFKVLGQTIQVFIPYFRNSFDGRRQTDWISWLVNGLSNKDLKVTIVDEEILKIPSIKFSQFNRNELNQSLNDYLIQNKNSKIIWGGFGGLTYNQLLSIPRINRPNRVQVDLYAPHIISFHDEIFKNLFYERILKNEFLERINNYIKETVKEEKLNFLKIKVLLMFFKLFQELFKGNDKDIVDYFDINLIKDLAILNSGRIYLGEIDDPNEFGSKSIKSFENIFKKESLDNLVIVVNEDMFDSLKFEDILPFNAKKILLQLAPAKTSAMIEDLWYNKFLSIIKSTNGEVTLFWEEGIENKFSLAKLIKEYIDENKSKLTLNKSINTVYKSKVIIEKISPINRLSPSTLKNYLDCPRKFYFENIKKLGVFPEFETEMTPAEKGSLTHEIIQLYLLKHFKLDTGKLNNLIDEKINLIILKKEKKLSVLSLADLKYELYYHSYNSLKYFNDLIIKSNDFKIEVEKERVNTVLDVSLLGRPDLVIFNNKTLYVFDFKRSHVPSKKEFEEFEEIQMWFYLSRIIEEFDIDQIDLMFGYLKLNDLSKSLLYSNKVSFSEEITNIRKIYSLTHEEIKEKITQYQEKEKHLVKKIIFDKEFLINPRSIKACEFCSANLFCPKVNS